MDDGERDRIRKNARAVIEEYRREQDERLMREVTVGMYDWATRQNVPITWAANVFRGAKNNWQEAPQDPGTRPQAAKKPRVRRICDRLNGLSDEDVAWLRSPD